MIIDDLYDESGLPKVHGQKEAYESCTISPEQEPSVDLHKLPGSEKEFVEVDLNFKVIHYAYLCRGQIL